ncbi:hypothetical protein HKX48_003640 [Thoreauomyces humboldtii]|nr:hypothetical protein HKX48_003640 [Thoreauomyces humboldtii]
MEALTIRIREMIVASGSSSPSPAAESESPAEELQRPTTLTLLRSLEATALTTAMLLPDSRERVLVSVAEVLAVMRGALDGGSGGEATLVHGVHGFLDVLAVMQEVGPVVDAGRLRNGVEKALSEGATGWSGRGGEGGGMPSQGQRDPQRTLATYDKLLLHIKTMGGGPGSQPNLFASPVDMYHPHANTKQISFIDTPAARPIVLPAPTVPTGKATLVLIKKEVEPALSVRKKLLMFGGTMSGSGSWKLSVCRMGNGVIVVYPPPVDMNAGEVGADVPDPETLSVSPLQTHTLRNSTLHRTSPTTLGLRLQNGTSLLIDFGDDQHSTEWAAALSPMCQDSFGSTSRRGSLAATAAASRRGSLAYSSNATLNARRSVSGSAGSLANFRGGDMRGSGYLAYPSTTSFVGM